MGNLEYDSIDAESENDRRKQLTDMVDDVLDASHLGPWKLDREDGGGSRVYVYNNTMQDPRPPLIIHIIDDDVIKLRTTAYGEPKVVAGQCKMARKAMPRGDSALEWVREHFELEE